MAETGFSQLSDESDERSHSIFAGYQSTSIKDASATDEESQIHILKEEAKSSLDSDDQALVVRPTPVPMGIWCRDLDYEVNGKKVILQGVTMCAKPGELTAVIGSSGAGKTSLINCLLNRVKRGKVRGERGLNSLPINDDTARRHMRYVMSADTNLPYLTVKETLYYTAQLRLPNLNKQQQIAAADEVIQWLRLQGCQDVLVGGSWRKGISKGQMKRLAIAQELLGNPEILILDEPTTGLDSALALELVHLLRAVARHSHKTVVASIHQPSQRAFEAFDRVILLSDGKLLYHGPRDQAVDYFAALGRPMQHGASPPDFLMEIATDQAHTGLDKILNAQDEMPKYSSTESLVELQAEYITSDKAAVVLQDIEELRNSPTPSEGQLTELEKYTSWRSQFSAVWRVVDGVVQCVYVSFSVQRSSQNALRNPTSTFVIVLVNVIQAILMGVIFFQLTVKESDVSTPSVPDWPVWDNIFLKYLTQGIDRSNSTPIIDPLRDMIEVGVDGDQSSMVFDIMVNPAMIDYIGDTMLCMRNLMPQMSPNYPPWFWEKGSIQNGDQTPHETTASPENHFAGDHLLARARSRWSALNSITFDDGEEAYDTDDLVRRLDDHEHEERPLALWEDNHTSTQMLSSNHFSSLSADKKYQFGALPLETTVSGIVGLIQILDSLQKTEFAFGDAETNRDASLGFWYKTASAAQEHASVAFCCLGFEKAFGLMGEAPDCVAKFPDYTLPTFPGAIDWKRTATKSLKESRRIVSSFLKFAEEEMSTSRRQLNLHAGIKTEEVEVGSSETHVSSLTSEKLTAARRRLRSSGLGGMATDLFNLIFRDPSNPVYPLVQNLMNMGETVQTCETAYCVKLAQIGETISVYLQDLTKSILSVLNVGGAVFFLVGNMGFMTYDVLLQFPRDRALFNKEKADGLYRGSSYILGKMLADFPTQLLPNILWATIFYFLIGFQSTVQRFFLYLLVSLLICFTAYSFGYFVSALSSRLDVSIITAPLILVVMLVMAGFMLRDAQVPQWIAWFKWFSIYRYGFFAIMLVQFPPGGTYGSIPNEVANSICGVVENRLWVNCISLIGLAVGFRILSYFALVHTNRSIGLEA